jgi:hypothetical protein
METVKRRTIDEILADESGILLDIGCGRNKNHGHIGIDMMDVPEVDIVHDLESFPWPIPDESIIRAVSAHVVEHINPHKGVFVNFMNEVWRVLKMGAQFAISTPYCISPGYFQDPTHCNPCNENTWAYFAPDAFDGGLYRFYTPSPWKIEYCAWDIAGNMEVILKKISKVRPEDNGNPSS